jgi:16S rRNA C967 or C1407 C5-methylase (RsmB/RsmF family)
MAGTKKPSSFVIHAFDKSEDRFRLLKQRMAEMVGRSDSIDSNDNADQGTTTSPIVHCHNVDFLQTSGSYASRSPDPSKRKRKQELIGNPGDDSHAGGGGDGKKSGGDKYVFENVRGILLDPSCSGSGMAKTRDQNFRYNAIDIDGDDVNDGTWNNINDTQPDDPFYTSDRVASLSNFQYQALLHAVTAYPSCKRVVYSTCSIYVEENERVVERVLQTLDERLKEDCGDIENDLVWDVVAPRCLQHWDRRGIMPNSDSDTSEGGVAEIFPTLTNNQVDAMIRVDPSTDATNGFFVACLQRRRRPQKVGDAKKSRATADFGKKSLVHLPTGLTYYTDEFRNGVKELSDSGSSKDKKKRIEKPVGIKIPEVADGGGSTNMSKIAKKKAKRLEWKKQQHLKKLERLQKKNPQKDFKSLSR